VPFFPTPTTVEFMGGTPNTVSLACDLYVCRGRREEWHGTLEVYRRVTATSSI
jgi:hypothetical protein